MKLSGGVVLILLLAFMFANQSEASKLLPRQFQQTYETPNKDLQGKVIKFGGFTQRFVNPEEAKNSKQNQNVVSAQFDDGSFNSGADDQIAKQHRGIILGPGTRVEHLDTNGGQYVYVSGARSYETRFAVLLLVVFLKAFIPLL